MGRRSTSRSSPHAFEINRERANDYLNTRAHALLPSTASPAGTPTTRSRSASICSRPYHALFMHNMLIRPTREELTSFGKPDYVIYNAGAVPRQPPHPGMTSKTSVDLELRGPARS